MFGYELRGGAGKTKEKNVVKAINYILGLAPSIEATVKSKCLCSSFYREEYQISGEDIHLLDLQNIKETSL